MAGRAAPPVRRPPPLSTGAAGHNHWPGGGRSGQNPQSWTRALPLLRTAAAAGGAVDAIVGGGGLIVLPTLMLGSGLPLPTILGTNKLAAVAGTSSAAYHYAKHTKIDWRVAGPTAGLALIFAGLGASAAGAVPASAYRPIVLAVLVGVALFVSFRPCSGSSATSTGRSA